GIELKRIDNRIHSYSENPGNTFYIGLNAQLENRNILGIQREKFSFKSGYDLEKIGIQLKKGNIFSLFRDKFLPIYKEKPKIEIKGEIYFNLEKEFDIMDIFHILNNQEYHYRYDTLTDEKIDKELEEAIIQMFSFERNN
ncbi:MAG TPA: hypothetical protein VEC16_02375, partial [Alphaproteobacteria bacterium]|nr:hypothetical protein [Alphaproteobacteria bacterium]